MRYAAPIVLIVALFTFGCRQNPYNQGEVIYNYACGNCHMPDGSGLAKLIPPLDSSRLTLSDPQKLVCLIRHGLTANNETGQEMPANTTLNEVELTNLINYLGYEYAFSPQTVQVEDIKKMLAGCHNN